MVALNPLAVAVAVPLYHAYMYGDVPPFAKAVADPLAPPLHDTGVLAVIATVSNGGCVIVTVVCAVQPLPSVAVTV